MVTGGAAHSPLTRYVPRMVIEWLRDSPETSQRIISGTCLFADLSGYTAMTERLAGQGTAGAEETGEILNEIFEALLSAAYDFGAELVKWGGDAVLLLFHGSDHAVRATRAAWVMQNTIARVGKVSTSKGSIRVRMSVGVHSGDFHFMLAGSRFRDLVVAGPATSETARMEAIASAGQVVLSDSTAALLESDCTRPLGEAGHLLVEPPDAPLLPRHSGLEADVALDSLFDPVLRDHLVSSVGDYEHRRVTTAFVVFDGADTVLDSDGVEGLFRAVDEVVSAVQDAAAADGVVILATDLGVDGGKIMLTSGAPNHPGDDATRMLAALTRIAGTPTRLGVRAGVTQGRVFAGDYGAPFRGTYSVAGDAVNLAARLAYSAAPRQIVTTPDLVALASEPYEVTALPPLALKGKSGRIQAVAIARPSIAAVATHATLPLIGRDTELAVLVASQTAAVGGSGTVCEVVGEPGSGKSRLMAELVDQSSTPVLRVDAEQLGHTRPYASIAHLLRAALDVSQRASSDEVAVALEHAVDTCGIERQWLPLLAIAMGITVPTTAEVDALESGAKVERLRRVTSDFLGRTVTTATTLIFEDTHAMDDASASVVRQLCLDVGERPWSIVLTRRTHGSPDASFPNATALLLAPLSDEDADALVIAAGTSPQLRALAATVAAGGNPDDLPTQIEDVLTVHMDRLNPAERSWLRTAAILGTRVDLDILNEILDEPFDPAGSVALAEYIRPNTYGTWVFAHQLIQRTAYEALPFRRRRTLHARASYAIERRSSDFLDEVADILAVHCLRGQRFDAAWNYARTAATRAHDRYALIEAIGSLETALEAAKEIPGLPKREIAAVAENLADVHYLLGQNERAERAVIFARRSARGDHHRLSRLAMLTARLRLREGKHSETLRWIGRGRRLLDPQSSPDLAILAELAELASLVHQNRGNTRQCRQWAEVAADEAHAGGQRQRAASALSLLAVAKVQTGDTWDPVDLSDTEGWDPAVMAEILNRLGIVAYYVGNLDEAATHYAEAESRSRLAGIDINAAIFATNRAEVYLDQGRPQDALPVLVTATEQLRAAQAAAFLPFALMLLGRATMNLGDTTSAHSAFTEAQAIAETVGDAEQADEAALCLARLRASD